MFLITKSRRFILFLCCSLILMALPDTTIFAATTDPNCSIALGTWQSVAPVPNNHIEGASAVANDELYIFTGFFQEIAGVLQPTSTVDIYNPTTDTWRAGSPSPFVGSHVQSASNGDFIYLVGGFVGPDPGAPTNAVWQYNTLLDNWTALPNLPEARASGGVVIHDNYLHYISGLDASRTADQPDHWILDLSNPINWIPLANLPQPRNHFQAVQIDQYIYAVGGQFGHDGGPVDLALVHAFNTETSVWEQRANTFGSPRSHAEPATFVLFDRIIVVGGRDIGSGQDTMDSIIMYNPQTDTWSQLGTIPTSLIGATANVINNQLIVTAGGTAYNVGQQQTWITDIISNCVTVPYEVNQGAINNVDLTYTGALNANRAGRIGDLITWTVNVINNGNVTEHFNIDVNLPDIVALRSVEYLRCKLHTKWTNHHCQYSTYESKR